MTISTRCIVCKTPSRKRLIELGWNDGMTAIDLSAIFNGTPSSGTILKHMNDHTNGEARTRTIDVQPTGTVRERVLALQELQLNEVERQITLAKERADQLNAAHEAAVERGADVSGAWVPHDWSEFFNILHKDNQAAIGSILKAQGMTDKREAKRDDLKLGMFDIMARSGLAPKAISGEKPPKQLPSGSDDATD